MQVVYASIFDGNTAEIRSDILKDIQQKYRQIPTQVYTGISNLNVGIGYLQVGVWSVCVGMSVGMCRYLELEL